MKNNPEITTAISRIKDLNKNWIKFYDGVYLGDPFCFGLRDNLLTNEKKLIEAIQFLKRQGKKVYLSTPLAASDGQITGLRSVISKAVKYGIDAIEVLDIGVMRFINNNFKDTKIFVNNFLTIFNPYSAKVLQGYNVRRLIPYQELWEKEIDSFRTDSSLEIELLIHGKILLGYAEICLINKKNKNIKFCRGACFNNYLLDCNHVTLRTCGRVTLSATDLCLLNFLAEIFKKKNYRKFRIETRFETSDYRYRAGKIYREYFDKLNSGVLDIPKTRMLNELLALSPQGFCNGYYLGRAGRTYTIKPDHKKCLQTEI